MAEFDSKTEAVYPDSVMRSIYNIVGVNADLFLIAFTAAYVAEEFGFNTTASRLLFLVVIGVLLIVGMHSRMANYYKGGR